MFGDGEGLEFERLLPNDEHDNPGPVREKRDWASTIPERLVILALVLCGWFWKASLRLKIFLVLFLVAFITLVGFLRRIYVDTHYTASPWKHHCALEQAFPPSQIRTAPLFRSLLPQQIGSQFDSTIQPSYNFGSTSPVGVFVGILTSAEEKGRRDRIRASWASHWVSRGRWEKGGIDNLNVEAGWLNGTERVIIRFMIGEMENPGLRQSVEAENELWNDIIVLPTVENMNEGKTYEYFRWAAEHAWVPSPPERHDTRETFTPFTFAKHDPPSSAPWVRPDYIVKADDDSFIMLAELEARLRTLPRNLAYWGYPVRAKHKYWHAGEAYALSFDLVEHISTSTFAAEHKSGPEDQMTAWWIMDSPLKLSISWHDERCWIYDGPKASTVYSRGFTFPDEVARMKHELNVQGKELGWGVGEGGGRASMHREQWEWDDSLWGDARTSSVLPRIGRYSYRFASFWSTMYQVPNKHLRYQERTEALIEGSMLSQISPSLSRYEIDALVEKEGYWGDDMQRLSRRGIEAKYMLDERIRPVPLGGTIVAHYLKRDEDWKEAEDILLHPWDARYIDDERTLL